MRFALYVLCIPFYASPMELKYIALTDPLYGYLVKCRSHTGDSVLRALRSETDALGDISKMQISEEQGSFMSLLVAAIGAKSAIEVGTFTGYSSICISRGLGQDGRLICVDESKEWTDIAQKYWSQAGVNQRIELRLGPAIPLLQKLEPRLIFDFAFIDASKTEYDAYYELLLPRIRPNGLILFDNMLWGGKVAQPDAHDKDTDALRALKLLFIDAGTRDEWNLDLGARILTRRLAALGVPFQHQEFDDGHRGINYRYDVSLPKLAAALGAT